MIPYLHLFGPVSIPTFGLMVALGLFTAAYVVQADFRRRGSNADAFLIIGMAGIAGIIGARLYHVLETPHEFFADPWPMIWTRFGFAWFGGLIGGFIALVILARSEKIPILEFLDSCAPGACVGYAIGRIGCLLSGDGDYGIPTSLPWGMSFPNGVVPTTERVHPTPLYEFIAWMLIALILWKLGSATIQKGQATGGRIFFYYLILTGIARFLVELIRINPRSFFGMSNAQAASVASVFLGVFLLISLKRRQTA
ncbi:MAG: prolipoprotein diacylglyceryl transferase [Acidobacteria bacterium]|nr:prolipoprotein diacylglyceryl transferase [Acidobacteriota bacterium]MBS1865875.1 prolipoprotein diacylglyceryl transferase [Acidobacteriota bacterium]